jgi:hypothetical protein
LKRQIALFLSHERLESIFIESEIFNKIKEEFEIIIYRFYPSVNKNSKIYEFKLGNKLIKFQKFVLDVETFRARKINVSFESRIRIITNLECSYKLNLLSFVRTRNIYGFLLVFIGWSPVYRLLINVLRFLSDIHPLLFSSKYLFNRMDLGIIFSGGNFSGMENTISRFLSWKRVPNLMLVDNWDNLSSKSIFWFEPDKILVWGENMKNDALNIQKIDESRIEIVGSYRLNSIQKENNFIENNVLYFVGSGLYHSYEIEILMNLSLFLQNNFNGDFNIVYRPHPYHLTTDRLHYLTTQLANFKDLTIDPEILSNEGKSFYTRKSIAHIEMFLNECDLVIGINSTVIVEALFLGKKVITYSMAELGVFRGKSVWDMYTHLAQIRNFNNLIETRSRYDFFSQILSNLHLNQLSDINYTAIYPRQIDFGDILISNINKLIH